MTDRRSSGLSRLFRELKRRRVFRVAGVYALVAWVVIEAADVIFPALRLPEWSTTLVVALALLGLPIAIVLAWAFDVGPEGVKRTPATAADPDPGDEGAAAAPATGRPPAHADHPAPSTRWLDPRGAGWLGAGILIALVAFGGYFFFRGENPEASDDALDANTVAVLPFRVAGADPSLGYLREGMLDLLAAKLTGESGPRAVDPRTLMNAWRRMVPDDAADLPPDGARSLARQLGAGHAVLGQVVGAPDALVVTASVHGTVDGGVQGPVTVRGPADSLPSLVDRLAAALLSVEAGEDAYRVASLTSTSLPALRAYLRGQAANRRGNYQAGRRHFETALQHDSTFALAALGLRTSAGWIGGLEDVIARALELAWNARDRLSPRDRAYLDALVGPRFPLSFSAAEQAAAWERALEAAPDRAEVLGGYGDLVFFHTGRILEIPDADRRAAEYMGRAVALDSGLVGALMHMVQLAAKQGDTARTRELASAYLARDSTSDGAQFVRWRAAAALDDSATLERIRSRFDSIGPGVLFWITIAAQEETVSPADAELAARTHHRRADTRSERRRAATSLYHTLLNRGRPAEAARVSEQLMDLLPDRRHALAWRVLGGLYSGGDSAAAAAAARALARTADAPLADDAAERMRQYESACVLEQWRLWRGERSTAAAAIDRLRNARSEQDPSVRIPEAATCAALLDALFATLDERSDAPARVARLDSLLRTGPPTPFSRHHPFVALARLHEAHGNPERALAAARSRIFWSPDAIYHLATMVREEGRLAVVVGDTAGAVRAYRHYLALRSDPEPALREEIERVRAELAMLTGERR